MFTRKEQTKETNPALVYDCRSFLALPNLWTGTERIHLRLPPPAGGGTSSPWRCRISGLERSRFTFGHLRCSTAAEASIDPPIQSRYGRQHPGWATIHTLTTKMRPTAKRVGMIVPKHERFFDIRVTSTPRPALVAARSITEITLQKNEQVKWQRKWGPRVA